MPYKFCCTLFLSLLAIMCRGGGTYYHRIDGDQNELITNNKQAVYNSRLGVSCVNNCLCIITTSLAREELIFPSSHLFLCLYSLKEVNFHCRRATKFYFLAFATYYKDVIRKMSIKMNKSLKGHFPTYAKI